MSLRYAISNRSRQGWETIEDALWKSCMELRRAWIVVRTKRLKATVHYDLSPQEKQLSETGTTLLGELCNGQGVRGWHLGTLTGATSEEILVDDAVRLAEKMAEFFEREDIWEGEHDADS